MINDDRYLSLFNALDGDIYINLFSQKNLVDPAVDITVDVQWHSSLSLS